MRQGLPFVFDPEALPDGVRITPARLRADDGGDSAGWLYEPAGGRARAVVLFSHPRAEFGRHYAIPGLVRAGWAAFGHNARYLGFDHEAIHERVLLDVAAAVRWLRARFEVVVLCGNSGGGTLMARYQANAARPPEARERDLPGGGRIDLGGAMPPGDGLVVLAAHPGEGRFLLHAIDPSVTDEADPLSCEPALDMYHPDNGFDPASGTARYAPEFLARYRAAQRERVARLDAIAAAQITLEREARRGAAPDASYEAMRANRRAIPHRLMVIYRTVANPAYVDLSIDPSDRDVGSIFALLPGRPQFGNTFATNVARVQAPRAWLSIWSGLSSRADFAAHAAALAVPTLFLHATGDSDILPADADAMWRAIAAPDRTRHDLVGSDHYLRPTRARAGRGDPRAELTDVLVTWLERRFR